MALRRLWQDNTTLDFAAIDPERTVAVLPVAIEQHGPHLPLSTDACINTGVVEHLLKRLPAGLDVSVLPMMPVGKSNEHQAYPGTLTLSAETLTRLWTEIGESVARAGVRKLVILNSHGGQPQVMDIVARDLRVRLGLFVAVVSYWAVAEGDPLFPAAELRHGIHGGSAETSAMLYLRPDLVRDAERRDFVPASVALEREYRFLRPEGGGGGGVGFGWQAQDLHPAGACGNALEADAERGRRYVKRAAEGLVRLLEEVARYPLSRVITGPAVQ